MPGLLASRGEQVIFPFPMSVSDRAGPPGNYLREILQQSPAWSTASDPGGRGAGEENRRGEPAANKTDRRRVFLPASVWLYGIYSGRWPTLLENVLTPLRAKVQLPGLGDYLPALRAIRPDLPTATDLCAMPLLSEPAGPPHPPAAPDQQVIAALQAIADLAIAIPQPAEIAEYLRQHPDLIAVVLKGARAARAHLNRRIALSLEIYRDPEIDDAYPTLYVCPGDDSDSLFPVIETIQSAYEQDLAGKSGWFLVTVDPRPRR